MLTPSKMAFLSVTVITDQGNGRVKFGRVSLTFRPISELHPSLSACAALRLVKS